MKNDLKYLNSSSKKYYCDSLFGEMDTNSIDEEIKPTLEKICKSDSFRTIFSKKGNHDIKQRCFQSYIRLAYTLNGEELLKQEIIPFFSNKYNINGSSFTCKWNIPRIQIERAVTKDNKGAKWLTDKNYFNISNIEFRLEGGDDILHNNFWNDLGEKLNK
ncbi:MAG TPA: hypothetical protein PLL09_15345 [Flavobacterium sp.]|uniref:hypothetical protein n=1 Tax=unclassified Flavobacterium TaxID=196869 RepID=UPI0025C724FA|nr:MULTISPECIES: hypothetical protein [unclassified Flavobacterium]HRE79191.1 hypothetical protein [Flavobacterium sp.]